MVERDCITLDKIIAWLKRKSPHEFVGAAGLTTACPVYHYCAEEIGEAPHAVLPSRSVFTHHTILHDDEVFDFISEVDNGEFQDSWVTAGEALSVAYGVRTKNGYSH